MENSLNGYVVNQPNRTKTDGCNPGADSQEATAKIICCDIRTMMVKAYLIKVIKIYLFHYLLQINSL